MFTGLVHGMGIIVSVRPQGPGATLRLDTKGTVSDVGLGDSIAINGVCLTATSIENKDVLSFDVSSETLKHTVLGRLRPGERVNLEPSLRASDRMGGHFVTGHVDAVGTIRARQAEGQAERITIEVSPEIAAQLVPKGSVAVDGISLTVVDVAERTFTLVIIPHTGALTTIGIKGPGDAVNIETDIIGKYVARHLGARASADGGGETGLMDAMKRSGFM